MAKSEAAAIRRSVRTVFARYGEGKTSRAATPGPSRRDRNVADTRSRVPDEHRASMASLRQRNTLLLAENRRLRDQVAELNAELAIAYGHRRVGQ